jgi:hypothetical protein
MSATLAPAAARAGDEAPPLSPAQVALFESDHLHSIDAAERLQYRFDHEASAPGDAYVDQINLDVRPRSDGAKDLWVEFLTGKHRVPFPPVSGFRGNPLLMYFLERDVETMHQQTGGSTTYFRNRIRRAFVNEAELRQTDVERDGKPTPATEITLTPFRGDQHIAAFLGLQEKRYRFILSDAVPGSVYELASEVPGEAGQGPRVKETVTFAATVPCQTSEGPCSKPQ